MAMESTVFVVSLMVIVNIRSSSQNANSQENYSHLINKMFGETEGNATPTPIEDRTIIQSTVKRKKLEPSTGQTWLERSPETVANRVMEHDKHNDVTSNNTTLVEDGNIKGSKINQFTSSKIGVDGQLDDRKILEYLTNSINSKSSLRDHGNVYNRARPKYLKSGPVEISNALPWYNSGERFEVREDNADLPNIFNSRRSFSGNNNTLGPLLENQKHGNQGLGVVLKEEIVFEIEDDKPPELSNPPVKTRLQTTTPESTLLLFKPKIKTKNFNTTYIPFSPSTILNSQRVLVNKSMYEQMKAQKINYLNISNHQKLLSPKRIPLMTTSFDNSLKNIRPIEITRHPENNFKLQMEFKKLNEKLNTLQEFLNKTLEKENETKTLQSLHLLKVENDSKVNNLDQQQSQAVSLLRTGHGDINQPILHRTVIKRIVNNGAPPLISNTNQRITEKMLPETNLITQPAFMSQVPLIDPRLQRRLMLLELANIAKLKHDIHVISRMRKRPKYAMPVYRRRVILKPIGRIL